MRTRTVLPKKTVRVKVKYSCACSHKFTRENTDWFTMNTFVQQTESEIREEMVAKLSSKQRDCPKCKTTLQPITT